ncbi:MAG: carbon-nitrogen hydrolase family protein [Niastella sp.]|nr:carbon-nitrogen hydrolase family protein [Niastella sp.]
MKIGVAQTKPVKGDIPQNIEAHKRLIALAIDNSADMIVFPELSVTGYEPELAKDLATNQDDSRLQDFQQLSDSNNIIIGVGMPLKQDTGITISMIIFQPRQPRQSYSKQHLHEDEFPYFVNGQGQVFLKVHNNIIAPAICYELSIPEHPEYAYQHGANIYIASVAKTVSGMEKANKILADTARKYGMTVLIANSLGPSDNFIGAGRSAIWNSTGELLAQLDDTHEGILIIDTETQRVIEKIIE